MRCCNRILNRYRFAGLRYTSPCCFYFETGIVNARYRKFFYWFDLVAAQYCIVAKFPVALYDTVARIRLLFILLNCTFFSDTRSAVNCTSIAQFTGGGAMVTETVSLYLLSQPFFVKHYVVLAAFRIHMHWVFTTLYRYGAVSKDPGITDHAVECCCTC